MPRITPSRTDVRMHPTEAASTLQPLLDAGFNVYSRSKASIRLDRINGEIAERLACGAILFNKSLTKVLLIRSKDGKWGFPKGHAEAGETIQQAARREVLEEVGVDINDFAVHYEGASYEVRRVDFHTDEFVAAHIKKWWAERCREKIRYPHNGPWLIRLHCFVVNVPESVKLTLQESEIAEARWMLLSDAIDVLFDSDQLHLLMDAISDI